MAEDDVSPATYEELAAIEDEFEDVDTEMSELASAAGHMDLIV